MRKSLLPILLGLMLTACSSDSNETTNQTPNETHSYTLSLGTGGYSGEWLRIIKNGNTNTITGCYSVTVKTGDEIKIFGEIPATADSPIILRLREEGQIVKETTLLKSTQTIEGEFHFSPCNTNGANANGYTNGGYLWADNEGQTLFTIE